MNITMPVKKGTKLWIEIQAESDTDLMDERELCNIIYAENSRLGKFIVNSLVLSPKHFQSELASDMLAVLVKHGVDPFGGGSYG